MFVQRFQNIKSYIIAKFHYYFFPISVASDSKTRSEASQNTVPVLKVVVLVTSWRAGRGDRSVTPVWTHGLCQGLRRAGPPLLCFKTGILPSNPKWHPQNLLVATRVSTPARACHWVWILPTVELVTPVGWRAQGGDPAPQCWDSRSPNAWWSPLTCPNKTGRSGPNVLPLHPCSKDASGESRSQFSVRKASSHPGLSRAGATHTWPLWIWRPGSRCANLPCTEEMHLLKSQIQDSSAPQPTCGTIITAFRLVFIVPIIWLIRSISDWEQE